MTNVSEDRKKSLLRSLAAVRELSIFMDSAIVIGSASEL